MSHLTGEQLLGLAKTIADDLPFSADARNDMEHIRTCGDCCKQLVAMAALLRAESAEGMAEAGFSLRRLTAPRRMQMVFSVSMQKIGENLLCLLRQDADSRNTWSFVPPLAAAARSAGGDGTFQRLEAPESERTFIQADSKENRLVVQIDTENLPFRFAEAHVSMPNGDAVPLRFTRHGSMLRAELSPLPGNGFTIVLTTQK